MIALLCVTAAMPLCVATYRDSGATVVVRTGAYRCVFGAKNGEIVRLECRKGAPLVVGLEGFEMWRLRYRDGYSFGASDVQSRGKATHRWDATTSTLRMAWNAPDAAVTLLAAARLDRLDLRLEIENRRRQPIIAVSFPCALGIPQGAFGVLTWPESVGLGLTRSWLTPPPGPPSKWSVEARGAQLMTLLAGFGARMLDLPGTPRPLKVTPEGRRVLSAGAVRYVEGRAAAVVRPPQQRPDVVFIENPDGPFLAGLRLGGKGLFVYFCGQTDEPLATSVVPALLQTWMKAVSEGKVALIVAKGRHSGGWMQVAADRWPELLAGRLGPQRVTVVQSPQQLKRCLQDPTVAAIFNPYAEHLMAADTDDARRIVELVRAFVRRGGLWLDAGGYPFYYVMAPARFGRLQGTYPPLFSDLIHLDGPRGKLAVYGVQRPGRVFVPARMELFGAEVRGQACAVYRHEYAAWIEQSERWQTPTVSLVFGRDLRAAALQYAHDNALVGPKLAEKLPRQKAERFVQSVLIRLVGRRCRDYIDYIEKLPRPNIIHMTEHLYLGFDRAYPDYLPPRPEFGTMEELRQLYAKARRLGFLMMPYVNPTWWCDGSPSLAKYGDAALSVGLDGKHYREAYGFAEPRNRGWSICAFHPLVRKLDERCLKQFVDDLGADILFQDQVGARGWKYDLNPAAPTPYAYSEGMLEIARRDSKKVALSTERGWDRLIPYEVQFCGVGWAMVPRRGRTLWSPQFWQTFSEGEWLCRPLALYMAHDRVAFALHDLGHFVDDERALAMALALGHQMSLAIAVGTPRRGPRFQWLRWLDVVQKQVARRYMGQPLTAFEHLSQLCVRGVYGSVTVVGSIEGKPVRVGDVTVAAPGYYARAHDGSMEAGRVVEYAGRRYDPPLEFVCERSTKLQRWWLRGAGEVLLPAARAARAVCRARASSEQAEIVAADGRQWVKAAPPPVGVPVPAELADRPPVAWKPAPKYIGVVVMEPNGPKPGWADAGPGEWVDALGGSSTLKGLGLQVRRLKTPEDILVACRDPRTWFAIVNPYGERFAVAGPDGAAGMLRAIAEYVAQGGIWWETGGYSFYYPCWPVRRAGRIVGWKVGRGIGGLAWLLGAPEMLPDDQPAEGVELSDAGRRLVAARAGEVFSNATATVNRPMPDDAGGWPLVVGQSGAYVAGYRPEGWGFIFRVGGVGQFKLTEPMVEATLAYLYTTPPRRWPRPPAPVVWEVVVTTR